MNSKLRISNKGVLKRPQHYHLEIYCYEDEDPKNHDFTYSTRFELVGNDIELIKSRAEMLASPNQKRLFVKDVKQCADPLHLEGIEE